MAFKETLAHFQGEINPLIARYFDQVIAEAEKEDVFIAEALKAVKDITMAGGKRLRAAGMYYGYLAGGGTERKVMLETAVSVECIHAFLLIHDDIMDRDVIRHGVPTIHERYRKLAEKLFPKTDAVHFGNSIALIVGDMVGALGNDIIFRSPFPKERIFQALSRLQKIIAFTVVGQAKDVYLEYRKQATSEEILKMYECKTAKYTMEGPVHLGLLLAGAPEEMLAKFSSFALPLGIAFQIQDDVLGLYGSSERIGKAQGSDLREGKMTLLNALLLERLSKEERKTFITLLGKGMALTEEDIRHAQELMEREGVLTDVKDRARQYIIEGREALLTLRGEISDESYDFFSGIAEYMMVREY
ncbi:MAG: polyprenyl synthetase family protein [Candidatus Moraniibacteriota bacterium]